MSNEQELKRLAFEACEASKQAETFEQRYQAAMVFAQCEVALNLDRIATVLEGSKMKYIKYTIKGHYGSYDINDTVILSDEDDRDPKDVLWAKYRRQGLLTLPMASTSLKVVNRELLDEDEQ